VNVATGKGLIWNLVVGIAQSRLYSAGHEAVAAAAGRVSALLGVFPDAQCTLLVIKGDLVLNNALFREAGVHGEKLVRLLGAKGVSRVDFLKGVDEQELGRFMTDVGNAEAPPGRYAHIRLGSIEIGLAAPADAAALAGAAFHQEQLARVQELYSQVSPFRELPLVGLEEVVANFLLTFRRGANLLQLLRPVKSHSEHTYTHAVNVSVLAMALADRLGLRDEFVQQIGIAALLHDVGKLLIPREILHKPGALTADEFGQVMQHPLYGAAYLARVEGLTPLAVLVALEHHRKYDTTGYPALRESGRRQHASSQIVAIADYYDALRSHRPYRRSLEPAEIAGVMQRESGSSFNPALLRCFTQLMALAAEPS
jgi:HD-GYP domain-containing protein (c-di-GMP phosphodiesterase class II)